MRYTPFIKRGEWILIGGCALAGLVIGSLRLIV